jgi:hypothetical protein
VAETSSARNKEHPCRRNARHEKRIVICAANHAVVLEPVSTARGRECLDDNWSALRGWIDIYDFGAGAPIRPHSAGFKGANLHPDRGQFLGKRFRKASNRPFRCMVRRAAGPSQAAADRRYLEDAAAPLLAHVRYGRTGDVNDSIEVGVNHCLEPLRTQLLERRNIAKPGVVNDYVETPKCGNRRLHGRLSRAFICHIKRNRANAVAVLFYQVIKSLRVACCGDELLAGFERSLSNAPA